MHNHSHGKLNHMFCLLLSNVSDQQPTKDYGRFLENDMSLKEDV